jgi:hypothetical protein
MARKKWWGKGKRGDEEKKVLFHLLLSKKL